MEEFGDPSAILREERRKERERKLLEQHQRRMDRNYRPQPLGAKISSWYSISGDNNASELFHTIVSKHKSSSKVQSHDASLHKHRVSGKIKKPKKWNKTYFWDISFGIESQ